MKKHIKKKYLLNQKAEVTDNPQFQKIEKPFSSDALKHHKGKSVFLQNRDDDEVYLGFIYGNSDNIVPMPLPDFTLVYFDFAYNLNIRREASQKELLEGLAPSEIITQDRKHELYLFYGTATSCIINLFTSIESFVNHLLPFDVEYSVVSNRKTEVFNRDQIQRYTSFDDKLKKVIPQSLGINFFSHSTNATQRIDNLKNLRDALIHTKSGADFKAQTETFKTLLDFKYNETFDAVVKLFNFYKSNYIEDCPCDKNF